MRKDPVKLVRLTWMLGLLNLALIGVFFTHYLNRSYPMVGHDFSYFLPRLVDTHLHYLINGLEIQWYTPTFGGGLPAFANPQHLQFSVPQLLLFVLDPWRASVVSVVLFACLGYVVCYFLLHRTLALTWQASTLGAIMFSLNGFYVNHMTVGHLNFLIYPMLPLLLMCVFDHEIDNAAGAMLISIVTVLAIFSAGFYLLVIFVLSIMVALPVAALIRPGVFNLRKALLKVPLAMLLALGMAGSKIYGVQHFMQLFPRELADRYGGGFVDGVKAVTLQLSAVSMMVAPVRIALGRMPYVGDHLSAATGASYGMWELDTSVSGILLLAVVLGVCCRISRMAKRKQWPNCREWMLLVALAITSWIVFDFARTRGVIYGATKWLPILRSLHVNVRYTAAFILPLVIAGSYFLDRMLARLRMSTSAWIILYVAALAPAGIYYLFSPEAHLRSFDVSSTLAAYKLAAQGETFPITQILNVSDGDTFIRRASSLKPYEPIFGYDLETFSPKISEGDVFSKDGPFFNMTDPTSLIYNPAETRRPFERFRVTDLPRLTALVHRRQPDWHIPPILRWLNWLAAAVVVLHIGYFAAAGWRALAARCRSRA